MHQEPARIRCDRRRGRESSILEERPPLGIEGDQVELVLDVSAGLRKIFARTEGIRESSAPCQTGNPDPERTAALPPSQAFFSNKTTS